MFCLPFRLLLYFSCKRHNQSPFRPGHTWHFLSWLQFFIYLWNLSLLGSGNLFCSFLGRPFNSGILQSNVVYWYLSNCQISNFCPYLSFFSLYLLSGTLLSSQGFVCLFLFFCSFWFFFLVQSDVAFDSGERKNYSGCGLFRQYSILFQLPNKNEKWHRGGGWISLCPQQPHDSFTSSAWASLCAPSLGLLRTRLVFFKKLPEICGELVHGYPPLSMLAAASQFYHAPLMQGASVSFTLPGASREENVLVPMLTYTPWFQGMCLSLFYSHGDK